MTAESKTFIANVLAAIHNKETVTIGGGQFSPEELAALLDDIEWTEKGLSEWRGIALEKTQQLAALQATTRIAIGHLQSVLNTARTFDEQQKSDTAARDWLISIGSEPQ